MNHLEVAKRWLAFDPSPHITGFVARQKSGSRDVRRFSSASISKAGCVRKFAVELKPERLLIGGVSLNKIDWKLGTGGGGNSAIANQHQGRGYGREAVRGKNSSVRTSFAELISQAFFESKLVNGYFDGNENSWAMQRKLGYRRVAEVTSRCMADGRQTIEHVTTLLRSDWEDREGQTSNRA